VTTSIVLVLATRGSVLTFVHCSLYFSIFSTKLGYTPLELLLFGRGRV